MAHYDRATPYGYYEPRHELRQDYAGRISTHTSIHVPDEPLTAGGQARRRIAVAVSTHIKHHHGLSLTVACSSAGVAEDARSSALAIQEMAQVVRRAGAPA